MVKRILKISLVLLVFGFTYLNADYTKEYLFTSTDSILTIKSGEKIKNIIDTYFIKNKENKVVIKRLESKLDILSSKLENKTDKQSNLLKIIINYLKIKVYFTLDDIKEKEIIIKKEKIIEEEEEEKIVFPGFSERYNDKEKTILAGEEAYIYAGGAGSFYEGADVGKVIFYITGDNIVDLKYSIEKAYLYVEGTLLNTVGYSDINIISPTKASITFDNINNFILSKEKNKDFRLSIKSNIIGYENIGKTMKDLIVSDVDFKDIVGTTSNQPIININVYDFSSEKFTISPGKLNLSIIDTLDTSYQIKFNVSGEFGKNTQNTINSRPTIEMNKVKILSYGADAASATYTLYNIDDSTDIVTGIFSAGIVSFDLSTLGVNNKTISKGKGENYYIRVSGINTGLSMEVLRNGTTYSILGVADSDFININLEKSINLGYRKF